MRLIHYFSPQIAYKRVENLLKITNTNLIYLEYITMCFFYSLPKRVNYLDLSLILSILVLNSTHLRGPFRKSGN